MWPQALLLIPWFKLEPIALPFLESVKIQPFGLLAALAIVVGGHFARQRAAQLGVSEDTLTTFLTWTTGVGLVSAYVLNAVMYSPGELLEALGEPRKLFSRYWGLSSYGGFAGGTLTAFVLCWRRRLPLAALADVWCYAIAFAWVFARMGCFVVHDHPGVASDFFLAVDDYDLKGVARHDLGLYEVLWSLVVAPLFYVLARRGARKGTFVLAIALLYGPLRFGLDFLRVSAAEGGDSRYLGLTPAQYFSLALTLFGVVFAMRFLSRGRREQAALI